MPPVTGSSLKDEEDEEMPLMMDVASTSTTSTTTEQSLKYKCPEETCGKELPDAQKFREHHRSHSKVKPYRCTFPGCKLLFSQLSSIIRHIITVHKARTRLKANKFVAIDQKVLDEEAAFLGIKKPFFLTAFGDEEAIEDITPTLPPFSVIYQTSSGHYICPFNGCSQQATNFHQLKVHYRVHCGNDYRPFRCTYPDPHCRYAANRRETVIGHIQRNHLSAPGSSGLPSDYVKVRTDWLKMEDDLFAKAEILGAPKRANSGSRTYDCTYGRCNKKFTTRNLLRLHLRSHTQSKPYRCKFPGCSGGYGYATAAKCRLLEHIQTKHFGVAREACKDLGPDERARAEKYVDVKQEVIEAEEAKLDWAVQKRKEKAIATQPAKAAPSVNPFGYESLDYQHNDDYQLNEEEFLNGDTQYPPLLEDNEVALMVMAESAELYFN